MRCLRVSSPAVTTPLPASARLAWWGTSWLRGHVVTDLVVDAVLDDDATHAVAGLPGSSGTETLVSALGLSAYGGRLGARRGLPGRGRPGGPGGPGRRSTPMRSRWARRCSSATSGVGLVPHRTGAAITWVVQPAQRRQLPDVGDADRALRSALVTAADDLARLDVARWNPEIADRLMNLRHLDGGRPRPLGCPARCVGPGRPWPPGAGHCGAGSRGRRRRDVGVRDRPAARRPGAAGAGRTTCSHRRLLARGLATGLSSGRGPDPELVAGRVGEVEAATAGEVVRSLDHLSPGRADRSDGRVEIVGVEQDQRAAADGLAGCVETADLTVAALPPDAGVVGSVVVERPPEGLLVERARRPIVLPTLSST